MKFIGGSATLFTGIMLMIAGLMNESWMLALPGGIVAYTGFRVLRSKRSN